MKAECEVYPSKGEEMQHYQGLVKCFLVHYQSLMTLNMRQLEHHSVIYSVALPSLDDEGIVPGAAGASKGLSLVAHKGYMVYVKY